MAQSNSLRPFGIVTLVLLSGVNLAHLLWTVHFALEQMQTGWGGGTNADLGVLLPWIVEILCLPAMITAVVYLIMAAIKKPGKVLLFFNLALFAVATAQYALTNLLIWY